MNTILSNITEIFTTTIINSHNTVTKESWNDNNDMKRILTYAIPLSCLAILMGILIVIGIHRRRHVLEKWTSLKRMRNTNPRFIERTGLRSDSEYEIYNDNCMNIITINENEQVSNETDFHLATIT